MSTRYLSADDEDDNTPSKRPRRDDSIMEHRNVESHTVPLDVLKAEARERRNSDLDAKVEELVETEEENCIICLQPVVDRTVLINCAHDRMCFGCIKQWSDQSRRCPLCNAPIGSHLIHRIRSQYDYQKHYLSPLRTSPPPANIVIEARAARRARSRRNTTAEEMERDELDRAIERRRWVYRHGLFAKHVASNAHTRFKPNPTPQQISNSAELQSRCQMFVRRELRVWPNLDVEFLTSFILSLVKSIDIRTEASIKLIAEFLDLGGRTSPAGGTIAEHFAHELYSYLRSPFRELPAYDAVVQYDTPEDIEAAPPLPRQSRSNHSHNQPGPSYNRSPPRRSKGKAHERETSDPLEASPRDINDESASEVDWVEPPPTSSKGKGKERAQGAGGRGGYGDRDGYDEGAGYGERTYGRKGREADKERVSQQSRQVGQRDTDYRRRDNRSSRRYEDDSRERDDKRGPKRYDGGRHAEHRGRSSREDWDDWRDAGQNDVSTRSRSNSRRSREGRRNQTRLEKHPYRPAGWNNFFEDNSRDEQSGGAVSPSSTFKSHSRSRSRSVSTSQKKAAGGQNRRHSRSPSRFRRRDSPPRISPRPLTTKSSLPEDERDENPPFEHTATETIDQSASSDHRFAVVSDGAMRAGTTSVRTRPARIAPMDAIRMHLQGPPRTSRSVCTGEETLRNPEAHMVDQKQHASVGPSETSAVTGGMPSRSSNTPDAHTLDDKDASPHVTRPTSNKVSYSIRGAAARPKSQTAPPSASDMGQRGSPDPTASSNAQRSRLLARLEAAKTVGTISNTDTDASHLAKKLAHLPTPSEISEPPVSRDLIATAQEELRLRLKARTLNATNSRGQSAHQGNNVGGGHQEKKGDAPSEPAAVAVETERRLRLHARIAARKRDISALMDASR